METLTPYLREHAEGRPLIARALGMTTPTLALARSGCYEQLRQARFDGQAMAAAIARAVGREVRVLEHFTTSTPFSESQAQLKYGERVRYQDSFAYLLREHRWAGIKGRGERLYGTGGWKQIQNEIWDGLRCDVARPLRFTFWDFDEADLAPKNTPGENLLTTLFYAYAAAFADDAAGLDDLEGVAGQLDLYIPIGEEWKLPGQWVLVRAPTAPVVH